ncbi:MAG: RHS repeat-associated core domain-containing protein, partial [Bacteroidota bacterium]
SWIDPGKDILQEEHYYPFGLSMAPLSFQQGTPNRYRYNGKELHTELGWYDYGFRWYDPAVARFVSVDPLAEDFVYLTTYQYASNSPIVNIDLDGLEGIRFDVTHQDPGLRTASAQEKAQFRERTGKAGAAALFVGSLFIPGPEDVVIAVAVTTKVAGALARGTGALAKNGKKLFNKVKSLFKKNDVVTDNLDNSLKEVKNPFKDQSLDELQKSENSFQSLVKEHEKKLEDFKQDPDKFDNKGKLKDATPEIREKIINGRIKKLEKDIQKQKNELKKVQEEINNRASDN